MLAWGHLLDCFTEFTDVVFSVKRLRCLVQDHPVSHCKNKLSLCQGHCLNFCQLWVFAFFVNFEKFVPLRNRGVIDALLLLTLMSFEFYNALNVPLRMLLFEVKLVQSWVRFLCGLDVRCFVLFYLVQLSFQSLFQLSMLELEICVH